VLCGPGRWWWWWWWWVVVVCVVMVRVCVCVCVCVCARVCVQAFGGVAGVFLGRPLARLTVRIVLPPGVRPRLAYLWLADNKPFPRPTTRDTAGVLNETSSAVALPEPATVG